MEQNGRPRGWVLSWIGGALLLVGGLAACRGGLSEMSCGDRSTGYDECMDDAASTRTGGFVLAVIGLGLVVVDMAVGRSR